MENVQNDKVETTATSVHRWFFEVDACYGSRVKTLSAIIEDVDALTALGKAHLQFLKQNCNVKLTDIKLVKVEDVEAANEGSN